QRLCDRRIEILQVGRHTPYELLYVEVLLASYHATLYKTLCAFFKALSVPRKVVAPAACRAVQFYDAQAVDFVLGFYGLWRAQTRLLHQSLFHIPVCLPAQDPLVAKHRRLYLFNIVAWHLRYERAMRDYDGILFLQRSPAPFAGHL